MKYKARFNLSRYEDKNKDGVITSDEVWSVQAGDIFDDKDVPDIADLIKAQAVELIPSIVEVTAEPTKRPGKPKPEVSET